MDLPAPQFSRRRLEGDDRDRSVCDRCGFVDYVNPRIVVGAVVAVGEQILLCRRAIEPRRGFWTLPAGYMESGETIEEAIKREAQEEACADLALDRVLAIYTIARISQVQILYRASLAQPGFAPGPESLEVALFEFDAIPWSELAFPTVHWALRHHEAARGQTDFAPFGNWPEPAR